MNLRTTTLIFLFLSHTTQACRVVQSQASLSDPTALTQTSTIYPAPRYLTLNQLETITGRTWSLPSSMALTTVKIKKCDQDTVSFLRNTFTSGNGIYKEEIATYCVMKIDNAGNPIGTIVTGIKDKKRAENLARRYRIENTNYHCTYQAFPET